MVIVSCTPHGWQGEAEAYAFFTSKVLALIKTRLFEHSFTWFECIDVTFVARKSLRAIVVYRPPGGVSVGVFLEKFSSLLQETVICPEELLIYGDFNFHKDDKADWDATRFGWICSI